MNIIPQKLTLDINRDVCFQVLVVKQGDRGSRFIEITLTADGQKLELGTIASGAVFSASLKGVLVQNEAFKINANTHTVTVKLSDNALAESGVLDCELSAVNAENEKVTSATFYVSVTASTKGKMQSVTDMLEGIVETKMLKDRTITGRKIALEEIGDEHLINKYWKTNRTSIILREGFLHDFIVQNSNELAKPFENIYTLLSAGVDGLECIGIGRCLGMFADADKFVLHNMITGKSCVVTFTEEEIVSVEEINSNKADQEYNPKSKNAQSGLAMAQAIEGIEHDFVDAGTFSTFDGLIGYGFKYSKTYILDITETIITPEQITIPADTYIGRCYYDGPTLTDSDYLELIPFIPNGAFWSLNLTESTCTQSYYADQTFDPETTPQSTNAISGKAAAEMLESVGEQWGKELDNKASVNIEDQGNYFVSETVEGALQELGAEVAGVSELLAQI